MKKIKQILKSIQDYLYMIWYIITRKLEEVIDKIRSK
jgi:hypothetical protein